MPHTGASNHFNQDSDESSLATPLANWNTRECVNNTVDANHVVWKKQAISQFFSKSEFSKMSGVKLCKHAWQTLTGEEVEGGSLLSGGEWNFTKANP